MPKPTRWKKPLSMENMKDMPDDPDDHGVYGFWYRDNGRCIYIGKTEKQSIRKRVMQHWAGPPDKPLSLWIKRYGKFLDICYILIKNDTMKQVDRMESKLIRLWDPETNIYKKKNKKRK